MDARARDALLSLYRATRTIAVVGASSTEGKDAHDVPAYLRAHGYRVIPVTPREGTLFDEPTRPSLAALEEAPDVVQVFRPPEEAEAVARAAIASGTKVLWFQPGTETETAVRAAHDAGLTVVWGRCMRMTHLELGLERSR
jgi:predicted CoA-binding protein